MITPVLKPYIYRALETEFMKFKCRVGIINGMPDHIHCLFQLNPNQALSAVIKQVKGASSHFINQEHLVSGHFCWQNGYAAFSVSESGYSKVYRYIKYQKQRHAKTTFEEEYEQFMKYSLQPRVKTRG